jgi:hypothetical protein
VIREFDADALYAALDAKRQALGLSCVGRPAADFVYVARW